MKTWKYPVANAQKFAANEYVSACYSVQCVTPNGNKNSTSLWADNGDGQFDENTDTLLAARAGYTFTGCNGWITVIGEEKPSQFNGFVVQAGEAIPVYWWDGDTFDHHTDGEYFRLHQTDSLDKIIEDGNKS